MNNKKFFTSLLVATTLTLNNIVLASERQTINPNEIVNIKDKSFENLSSQTNGGAILINGGSLTVDSTSFNGNKAVTNHYLKATLNDGYKDWTLNLETHELKGIVDGKEVTYYANYNLYDGNSQSQLTIYDSKTGKDIVIGTVYLQGNGGAIYNRNGTLTVNNSIFKDNYAINNRVDGYYSGVGGAIYNKDELYINDSVFENNKAHYGGAVANGYYDYDNAKENKNVGNLVVKNSKFINNSTTDYNIYIDDDANNYYSETDNSGGAIFSKGSAKIENSLFIGNKTIYDGGALWNSGSTLEVKDSVFKDNIASGKYTGMDSIGNKNIYNMSQGQGGAIDADNDNFIVENSVFENNSSGNQGGAVNTASKNTTITDSNFISNNAIAEGGAINIENYYHKEGESNPLNVEISNTNFENNKVQAINGRGILLGNEYSNINFDKKTNIITDEKGNTYSLNNCSFSSDGSIKAPNGEYIGHYMTSSGGAINIIGDSEVTISDSQFKNNSIELNDNLGINIASGGAVNSNSKLNVRNSIFDGNSVNGTYTNKMTYPDSVSEETGKFGVGGAISSVDRTVQSNDGTSDVTTIEGELLVSDSTFNNNSAVLGGAIYSEGSATIKKGTFTNNTASSMTKETRTYNFDGKEYTAQNEYDTGRGGAIDAYGDLLVDESIFENNTAANGGAISYMGIGGKLEIKNSTFKNNSANPNSKYGYYERNDKNEVEYKDTSENYRGSGGALSIMKLDALADAVIPVAIDNTVFEGNSAYNGGAISLVADVTNINGSAFRGNTAVNRGGAIHTMPLVDSNLNIVDTDFIGNTAKEGGAIYAGSYSNDTENVTGSNINILAKNKDVIFSGNKAEKGADIYLDNSTLNLNANVNKLISFDGGIVGKNSVININDPSLYENSTGKIVFGNFVSPDKDSKLAVNLKGGTLNLTDEKYLDGTDLTLDEGSTLDLINGKTGTMNLNSITSNNADLNVELDLTRSDGLDFINANSANGSINIKNVSLLSDIAGDETNDLYISLKDVPDTFTVKTAEGGVNTLTNTHIYNINADDEKITINRLVDENGKPLIVDGFTVAVNQTDKVAGKDIKLSDTRTYSALEDINITGKNSERGWIGELGGTSLAVVGNGHTLNGSDNKGIAISDGQTLDLRDLNIKGFKNTDDRKGTLTVKDGGLLYISAINSNVALGDDFSNNIIYFEGDKSNAFLNTQNSKEITVNNNISSANKANELNLTGDGTITFNGIVDPLTINNENKNTVHNNYIDDVIYNLNSGTVSFTNDKYLNGNGHKNTLNFNGGTLNLANSVIGAVNLASLNLTSNSNIMIDADLANKTMDTISADNVDGDAILNVSHINLLSDAKENKTEINFVNDETLASHITSSVSSVSYSPIYKYDVSYDSTNGNFLFSRGGGVAPGYNNVNPAVMVSPVAAQIGGYIGMLDTYNNAFSNMDMRMLMPSSIREAQKMANRYAISDAKGAEFENTENTSGGSWLRPFTSYDSVGLKGGPKVHSVAYGSFFGGDSGVHDFGNGLEGVFSAHISYLGSHQTFAGNSIVQNGGNIGLTGTLYKGNFFTGLSAVTGASAAEANTIYGSETFPVFTAGVANKTGYNIEFKDGRFIFQPSLLLSYTYVNTFNYTNAADVQIAGDGLHALQLNPNLRFIANTRTGWQPYLTFGVNWNVMNDSQYMANTAALPELSVKPYFQYGIGVQKLMGKNFTGYAQVVLRNGGRNGIAANAGFKYLLGRETI